MFYVIGTIGSGRFEAPRQVVVHDVETKAEALAFIAEFDYNGTMTIVHESEVEIDDDGEVTFNCS